MLKALIKGQFHKNLTCNIKRVLIIIYALIVLSDFYLVDVVIFTFLLPHLLPEDAEKL
jgi:hypothetical protein